MMNNKFIEIETTAQGKVLVSFQYIVGLLDITAENIIAIPCLEQPNAASSIQIVFGVGATMQTNAATTRRVFYEAIEKLYSTGYTDNVVQLVWPDAIIDNLVLVI